MFYFNDNFRRIAQWVPPFTHVERNLLCINVVDPGKQNILSMINGVLPQGNVTDKLIG